MPTKVQDQELFVVLSKCINQLFSFGIGKWYMPQVGEGCQNLLHTALFLLQVSQVVSVVAVGKCCKDDWQLRHGAWVWLFVFSFAQLLL